MPRTKTGVRIPFWRITLMGIFLIGGIEAAERIEFGFRGPSYPVGTGGNSRPTGEKPESKLWWNDKSWWGILWSNRKNAYTIHELSPTQDWVDKGTVVDDRPASRADVGWDGQRLYVASHVFSEIAQSSLNSAEWGELYRFSYNTMTRTYHLDPGFPVTVTRGKSEALVLEKDSTSRLWVTYVEDGRLMVNHSVCQGDGGFFSGGGFACDDQRWRPEGPFVVPVPGADQLSADDISSIIAFNGFIGVMWSDQTFRTVLGDTELTGAKMNFAVHKDDQNPSLWLADVIFSHGDDHVNLKALQRDGDGNVFAVIKTEKDSKTVMLLVCKSSLTGCRTKGEWAAFEVFRDEDGDPTRPILLIDARKRELYVFATIENDLEQRGIHYKKSPADAIRFPTGPGATFIRSATDTEINDATSTKQNLNITTGLVVLASDEGSMHYFHNFLPLP